MTHLNVAYRMSLLLFCVQFAQAANLEINGPEKAIANRYVTLTVTGLPAEELSRAEVSCQPSEGVSLLPASTWGGQPILMFLAPKDGEYEITISLNGFVRSFVDAQDKAQAAQVDEETLAAYRSLHTKLVTKYPYALARHKITVGKPEPPPPPPVDKVQILIIEETSQRRPPYGDLYIELRRSDTLRDVELYIVDRDGKTPDGKPLPNIAGYVAQIKGNLPYLFVIGEVSGTRGEILWKGTCPPKYADVIELVDKYRKVD